jgi:ATP-dependent DNA helicase RecG
VNQESLGNIKGIGPKMLEKLQELGIFTLHDLMMYFPNRYDHYEQKPLYELVHEDKVTIVGEVMHQPVIQFYNRKKSKLTVSIKVENSVVKAVLFNRAFAKNHFEVGEVFTFSGKWDQHRLQITVDQFKKGTMEENSPISPIYPLKGNIKNNQIIKVMTQVLSEQINSIEEILPVNYLKDYKLPIRKEAFQSIHFPPDFVHLKHAKRRFIYEEFLLFQLKMQLLRKKNKEVTKGNQHNYNVEKVNQLINKMPFHLTNAQQRSLKEILEDLHSPYRMNRLLQGDVGSGKTAIAIISLYAAITAGKQTAFMVPTEILAEQHEKSLRQLLPEDVIIERLTGSVKGKKRKEVAQNLEAGIVNVVIGTHALIQEDVHFANLGYIVIDEQHRFGVQQRNTLKEKGILADCLFMTATPIPRTLSITAFGDMDVSKIDEMPVGRKAIKTYWIKENMMQRVLSFIDKELANGAQAYVVCPLIEESDKLDIQNAVDLYFQLQEVYKDKWKVGLMHGRLNNDEKERVMHSFTENETQILVSTTVVEVGVNVPNATVMMIQDADRFGLSQLHQLRGRVGRGDKQSYCILVANPKGDTGRERMRIMTETTDGFVLAEKDLELRGPGDIFGIKQSGLPDFKLGDLAHDYRALETARNDAIDIIYHHRLREEEFQPLLKYLKINFDYSKEILN